MSSEDLSQWPWYHGMLTRPRAEELLMGAPDGVYLIRDSSTYNGDYTLSISYKNKFRHYRIKWVTTPDNPNHRLSIDNKRFFNNMIEFIDIEKRERMPTPPPEPATEPMNFNAYVIDELITLNKRVEDLAKQQDRLEMWGRRKILLFHGVPENGNNNEVAAILKIIKETLRLQLSEADIRRSHRIGQANNYRSRPILVKFKDVETRDTVWYNKVRLVVTGITMSEFLTKERYMAYAAARQRFGVTNCWTKNGVVVVTTADGSQHQVTSVAELSNITSPHESIYN